MDISDNHHQHILRGVYLHGQPGANQQRVLRIDPALSNRTTKMIMKHSTLILALVTGCCLAARAGVYDTTFNSGFANGGYVPEGNTAGWSSSETLSGETGTISSISVNLDITGGFNGSLYGYL